MSNCKNKKQGRNFTLQQVQGIKFQKKDKKVIVAISPKQNSLRSFATGQAGGLRKREKVIVAMSGGVDSSVAAGLLKNQGYDVSGVFMIFQKGRSLPKDRTPEISNKCCSQEARDTAQAVAAKLKIPFYVMDFSGEFKKRVIDYFLREYKQGRTPNPCVMCNRFIKFGLLLDKALALGYDFVATGHYVQSSKFKVQSSKFIYRLYEAHDKTRDQSYFLYTLTQDKLRHLLFPLANYLKSDVWQLARDWRLPIRQNESRGICFVEDDIGEFLRQHLKFKKGPIKDINSGKILGEHQGLPLYTIGQRQAIGIGGIGPFYVVRLDVKNNILWVTNNPKDKALFSDTLLAIDVSWVSGREPKLPSIIKARIRYGHKAVGAEVSIGRNGACFLQKQPSPTPPYKRGGSLPCSYATNKNYLVKFKKPQRAITPGQAVVFYGKCRELLGGGIIQAANKGK